MQLSLKVVVVAAVGVGVGRGGLRGDALIEAYMPRPSTWLIGKRLRFIWKRPRLIGSARFSIGAHRVGDRHIAGVVSIHPYNVNTDTASPSKSITASHDHTSIHAQAAHRVGDWHVAGVAGRVVGERGDRHDDAHHLGRCQGEMGGWGGGVGVRWGGVGWSGGGALLGCCCCRVAAAPTRVWLRSLVDWPVGASRFG